MLDCYDVKDLPQTFLDGLKQVRRFKIIKHPPMRANITKLVDFLIAHPGLQTLSMAIDMGSYFYMPYHNSTGDGEDFGALKGLRLALAPLSTLQVARWHRIYPHCVDRHRMTERQQLQERARRFQDFRVKSRLT